jgi:26S proteasome regulatory subunit N9
VEEPILYVKMQIAAFKLQGGEQQECKKYLEEGKATLESMTDVDPSVHASVHWGCSQYHKSRQEFAEFYKSALLYLAYTSVDTLSDDFKLVCYFILIAPFLERHTCAVFPSFSKGSCGALQEIIVQFNTS